MHFIKALSLLLGVALFLAAPSLLAQPARSEVSQEDYEKAKKLFEEAEALYKLMDFQGALEKYKEAYLLSKRPGFLFNIGQCYRQMEQYREALISFQTYLDEDPKSPFRVDVEQIIQELTVKAAEEEAKRAQAEAASLAASPPAPLPQDLPREDDARPLPMLFYSGAAAVGLSGVVTGVLAVSTSFSARRQANRADSSDALGDIAGEINQKRARANALAFTADILLGAALVSGGMGYLLERRFREKKVRVSLFPLGVGVVY